MNNVQPILANATVFLKALRQAATATAMGNRKAEILHYINVETEIEQLKLTATNGYVFEEIPVPASVPASLQNKHFLISGKEARGLSKAPTRHGNTASIVPLELKENNIVVATIVFDDESIEISNAGAKLGFPSLNLDFKKQPLLSFSANVGDLRPLLTKLKKDTDAKHNNKLHLVAGKSDMTVELNTSDVNGQTLQIQNIIMNSEQGFCVDFNLKFIQDAIKYSKKKELVTLKFFGKLQPFIVSRENGGDAVISPIRV